MSYAEVHALASCCCPSATTRTVVEVRHLKARTTTSRTCYVCGRGDNPIIAVEPIERRFGRTVLPEDNYVFARCRGCRALYVDSDVTDAYLADLYGSETADSIVELTGGRSHDDIVASRLSEFRLHWDAMKQCRPVQDGDELLDFGCQTGEFGTVAQRDGVRPHGIELSPSYAATARRVWGQDSTVHPSAGGDAPFFDGQFSYITAFETLEHMCDPIAALRTMAPWLRDDGIFAMSVPSADYFHLKYWVLKKSPIGSALMPILARNKPAYRRQALPHTHIYNFSYPSLRVLLHRGGFRPISVSPTGWRGGAARLGRLIDRTFERLPGLEIGLAPSLFALAKRA